MLIMAFKWNLTEVKQTLFLMTTFSFTLMERKLHPYQKVHIRYRSFLKTHKEIKVMNLILNFS